MCLARGRGPGRASILVRRSALSADAKAVGRVSTRALSAEAPCKRREIHGREVNRVHAKGVLHSADRRQLSAYPERARQLRVARLDERRAIGKYDCRHARVPAVDLLHPAARLGILFDVHPRIVNLVRVHEQLRASTISAPRRPIYGDIFLFHWDSSHSRVGRSLRPSYTLGWTSCNQRDPVLANVSSVNAQVSYSSTSCRLLHQRSPQPRLSLRIWGFHPICRRCEQPAFAGFQSTYWSSTWRPLTCESLYLRQRTCSVQ